jgi:hypothetical protein
MATPSAPQVKFQPFALPNTLVFAWRPPLTGDPVTHYRITLEPGTIIDIFTPPFNNTRQITGLTNAVTYTSQIEASADGGSTWGTPGYFQDFQPGSKPTQGPATATAVRDIADATAAIVSWTPPSSLPDATIFWYVILSQSSNASDPVLRFTGDATSQSNLRVTGLNSSSSYSFSVQAVNCPGYSPKTITNTITAGFDPTTIAGLQVWYDGNDASSVTLVSGKVSQWSDKSGNARHATQSNATYRPTYSSNSIVFSNTFLLPTSLPLSTNQTLFMVASFTLGTGPSYLYKQSATGGGAPCILYTYGTPNAVTMFKPSGIETIKTNVSGRAVITLRFTNGGAVNMYYNNDAAIVTTYGSADSFGNYDVMGGSSTTVPQDAFIGSICEWFFYNSLLTNTQVSTIQLSLMAKWGIV